MNKNSRRSSLRKALPNEDETITTAMRIKRRISFSGKKSVREFVNTEEPKNWDNSYEVSDHLIVEDSSGSGPRSGTSSQTKALNDEDKENISLPVARICERSHIDVTLNLQTSIDVTLLPCELLKKQQQQKPLTTVRDSLALSLEERKRLQDTFYDHRIMDKTLDVMSGSLVARMQKSILHNASDELVTRNTERENSVHTTAAPNCIGDSFMDITPLELVAPPPAPASVAPASHPSIQQLQPKDIEVEMFADKPNFIMSAKENVNPAQKSLFMEMEEVEKENVNPAQKSLFMEMEEVEKENVKPAQKSLFMEMEEVEKENVCPTQNHIMEMEETEKQTKNKTQHEVVDISFACSFNVSPERDLLPPPNMSFESASSANSTINFKDESMLIPPDMISGKRISKKINFRQLNEELEAGKIQLFPNGPKTPTTDRKTQRKRYLGQEGMDAEEKCPARDIRSSIKPRTMLNFSEMALSPLPIAPVQKQPKDRAKDKDKDDKCKYRLSQADEIMLDNTNFLAHARLGDETQSRNTSKNSTRRETTYDYSELDLEGPTHRQDFHPPMPSTRPRQTIHLPEEIEADQSVAFSAIPVVKTKAPPPRRTLYMNESMDQEVSDERREKEAREETKAPVYASMSTKRRETLLTQVSMEEEMEFSMRDPPDGHQMATKPRQTLLLAEPIEEEMQKEHSTFIPSYKSRKTITRPEAIEEDMSIIQPKEPSLLKYKALEAPHRPKSRHTLLMAEPIEEEELAAIKPNNQCQEQSRSRPRNTILMAEPISEDLGCMKSESMQQTLVRSESTSKTSEQEDLEHPPAYRQHPLPSSKPRQTIHQPEEMQEDLVEFPAAISAVKKSIPRRTLYMNDSIAIEQEIVKTAQVGDEAELRKGEAATKTIMSASIKTKRRETILMQESMEEEIVSPLKELTLKPSAIPMENAKSKARHTLHMAEPLEVAKETSQVKDLPFKVSPKREIQIKSRQDKAMEEEMDFSMKDSPVGNAKTKPTERQSDLYSKSKARHTLHMAEPLEVEKEVKDLPLKVSPKSEMKIKSRQDEAMEEEIDFSMKDSPVGNAKTKPTERQSDLYSKSKARHTLHMAEPLEVEKEVSPVKDLPPKSQIKSRLSLLLDEAMEEEMDTSMKDSPFGNAKTNHTEKQSDLYSLSKCRKSIIMSKPIEEDDAGDIDKEACSGTKTRQTLLLEAPKETEWHSKCRKTLINPEPIEEDDIAPHLKEHFLPRLPRHTLYLEEPIEEEMRSNEKEKSNYYQSSKPRKTIIKSEPMEEEQNPNTTEAPSLRYQQKESRQTFVMAEPIEEDQQVAFKANDLPIQEEKPRLKSRNTILMAEPILEDLNVKARHQSLVNKPAPSDYQSPQGTIQNADLRVITPLPNPRLTSIYRELGAFTPGMSLTEFEDQEEMCKTPLPKAKQKKRSIYQPTKMELMEASGFGTPVSHGNQKRLPQHLTPNLPESKKRHTQLFADSQMEMEVEMENCAWQGPSIELEADAETHRARSTFMIDQFEESVQPVRDYRAALSQLVKVSSLDDVLQLKQQSELEEKPITISDVTNYFLQEKQEEQRKSSGRESGSSDRTFKSYAVTNTKFINLSGDTTIFAGAVVVDEADGEDDMEPQNQIDNEQISLVSTLAEETDENEEDEQPDHKLELCQAQITPFVIAGSSASCKKCGNCNRSLSETKLSADSFVLPQQNLFDFTKESQRLRRLRLKPSFEEMQKHWKMRSLETVNDSLDETKVEEKPFHWDKAKLMQKLKRPRRKRGIAPAKSRESFFDRLDRLLAEQQPNWIFDFQLKVSRQLIFYHRLLTTFRIVVNYNVLDEQDESAIRVCSITEDNAVSSPPERWTTFEHYLNFQLSLKMPMNLSDAIGGSDVECFRKFLHRIDQIVVEIKRTFHKLMTVLTATNATLLRQSNRIFVSKTVTKCNEDEPLIRFERFNFLVQITNVEETCFSDVLQPELYLFREKLQFLPKGIAFLEAFLPNPEQYLNTQT